MHIIKIGILRLLRGINKLTFKKKYSWYNDSDAIYRGQQANDYIYEQIKKAYNKNEGLCISKFGTIELSNICAVKRAREGLKLRDYIEFINGIGNIFPEVTLSDLYYNAGFFPKTKQYQEKYVDLVIADLKDIDILGTYQEQEKYLKKELEHCIKITIDGYYAPFFWKNPWTKFLQGKRVLVIHPFTDSIEKQYKDNREKIFEDKDVLPEFEELILLKAVQSMADNSKYTEFSSWFDALKYMEDEIDRINFDIALIGCGAYGMELAAYIKRKNRIAVHMAGWTQMLFGIYGNRWVHEEQEVRKYINEYWIRPSKEETPEGVEKVEHACYW